MGFKKISVSHKYSIYMIQFQVFLHWFWIPSNLCIPMSLDSGWPTLFHPGWTPPKLYQWSLAWGCCSWLWWCLAIKISWPTQSLTASFPLKNDGWMMLGHQNIMTYPKFHSEFSPMMVGWKLEDDPASYWVRRSLFRGEVFNCGRVNHEIQWRVVQYFSPNSMNQLQGRTFLITSLKTLKLHGAFPQKDL